MMRNNEKVTYPLSKKYETGNWDLSNTQGLIEIQSYYCMTKQTSALFKHNCWLLAIAYRVIHVKRAAARTHDACVFTTRQ